MFILFWVRSSDYKQANKTSRCRPYWSWYQSYEGSGVVKIMWRTVTEINQENKTDPVLSWILLLKFECVTLSNKSRFTYNLKSLVLSETSKFRFWFLRKYYYNIIEIQTESSKKGMLQVTVLELFSGTKNKPILIRPTMHRCGWVWELATVTGPARAKLDITSLTGRSKVRLTK